MFDVPDKKRFRRDFDPMLGVIRDLAEKYADAFVPLDEMFAASASASALRRIRRTACIPTHRAARLIADNLIKKIRLFL